MLEILKKIFFALLPFLQKAAEDALNDATASKGGSESSQKSESRKGESRQGEARTSGSSAPKPSAPKPSASTRSASTASASDGSDYPGDYRDMINFEYSPSLDGDADPGEIVWTWVPFEEDHSQGKDRPVLLVGRDGEYLLALMMTSKDHNNREHADPNYLDIGSGPWDPQGRASEVKLNRVIRVRPDSMRREGAIMPEDTFRLIERAWTRHNG
ncbi:MAG: type II toxin-antitoxin system PemK/MazF family toxin [Rothia sp.]|uniref:type II toxin-antitoxin system PemK/MazF family toxin n=1 Tax=Rothia sp. (in: high G+C Gram-positive bacteria) TaxID=1885016 RepID=UPI001CACE503|nr:type II toxin-antitoxin system PemK/MazF family toxin [Rothia sp. (in: high G+C Gram-positive bacteria)]MBF1680965.1 type II toxin-antitoxin system PemK/MazF family toxin [Rothia sp. (in: high G+C Gram-positive bacteria)]